MSSRLWDRASLIPAVVTRRRAELVALPSALPDVQTLFTFMRDAELRFETLRMKVEEHTFGAGGDQIALIDVMLQHPGLARVTTSLPGLGVRANYEVWISDGTTVRTYSGQHRLGTERPVRPTLAGLDNRDLPPSSRVYRPVTPLPMETLPDAFVHPAGFLQNVLATGPTRIVTTAEHLGRETFVVESDHPRATEVTTDLPDHAYEMTVDRETGVILRLVETVGSDVTRDAFVTAFQPNAILPPNAFAFSFPSDATILF